MDKPEPRVESEVFKLPLVCKKFVKVLERHPQFRSHLKICRQLSTQEIVSVAAWLRCNKGYIAEYTDHSSGWCQDLLVTLLSYQVS